jgi:hypothetical protein
MEKTLEKQAAYKYSSLDDLQTSNEIGPEKNTTESLAKP